MRKVLKKLGVIQDRKLGLYKRTESRINPYNPLSYVIALMCLVVGIILFGIVGFWDQTSGKNQFKWH